MGRNMSERVSAKYKDKKKIKTEDGGEATVYEYSEGQVEHRHREKAKKLEGLRKSIDKLRDHVKQDLKSEDADTRLTALAVAVIDETCERPGNDESAEDRGHFGVTTLQKRHVSFSSGKAILKYTGKSGVDHEKTVEDKKAVAELKKAIEGKKDDDLVFCDGDDCTIRAKDVNAYLKPFGVTAKDIRGMRANEEMKTRLKELRSKGPELPKGRKEKDEVLKKEFNQALKETAEVVGHEEATLKGQYLVPKLEDSYMHDGTVIDKLHEKASSARVAFRHLLKPVGPSFRRVAGLHLAAELEQLGRTLTDAWSGVERSIDDGRSRGLPGDSRTVRSWANRPWVEAITAGRKLAERVLTEKSIPKGLHKKVEMAARFFMSARRMPKDMYKWIAKSERHYVLIMQAMSWPDKQAGGLEMFTVGPFTVHNTLGLENDELEVIKTAIERSTKLIKTSGVPGISGVLYGDIHVVGKLQGGSTLAWYNPGNDKVHIRPLDSAGHDSVHSLVHELGHRYWDKKADRDAKREWVRHHRSVGSGETANFDDVDAAMPKVGDPLPFKVRGVRGGPPIVTDIKSGQHWFKAKIKGVERELSISSYTVRESIFKEMARKATWPTPYSKKNYEEHFCEAFALKALKGLKEPHLEAFNRIW
jgi:DNA topoisomerase-1